MIFINHASAPIREKRLSIMSKARREASRNKFVEKDGMTESKALEKSIVERIVREPGLGLSNPSEKDGERNRI